MGWPVAGSRNRSLVFCHSPFCCSLTRRYRQRSNTVPSSTTKLAPSSCQPGVPAPLAMRTMPTNARIAVTTMRTVRSISGRGLEHHGSSIGNDLTHRLADLGRVEAHHDDGVGMHEARVTDHPVHGVTPRLLEELGVLGDLAADDGAQARHDVTAESAAPHDDADHLALHLANPLPGHILGRHDKHCDSSIVQWRGRVAAAAELYLAGSGKPNRGNLCSVTCHGFVESWLLHRCRSAPRPRPRRTTNRSSRRRTAPTSPQ